MFDWYFLENYLENRQAGEAVFEANSLAKAYLAQIKTAAKDNPEYVRELQRAVADFIQMYRQETAGQS